MLEFVEILFLLLCLVLSGCGVGKSLGLLLFLLLAIADVAGDLVKVLHFVDHSAQSLCGCNQQIDVLLCRLGFGVGVNIACLPDGVVSVGKARVGHYLGQDALQRDLVDLLLLLRGPSCSLVLIVVVLCCSSSFFSGRLLSLLRGGRLVRGRLTGIRLRRYQLSYLFTIRRD